VVGLSSPEGAKLPVWISGVPTINTYAKKALAEKVLGFSILFTLAQEFRTTLYAGIATAEVFRRVNVR